MFRPRMIGAALVTVLVACGGSDSSGPGEELYVRAIFDFSGPTKEVVTQYGHAFIDNIDYLNENGGIKGRLLNFEYRDNKYEVDLAEQYYAEWKQTEAWDKVAVIFGNGTAAALALNPQLTADEKPYLSTSYASEISTPVPIKAKGAALAYDGSPTDIDLPGAPYIFHPGTDYSTSARIAVTYIKGQNAKKMTFAFDVDCAYCRSPVGAAKETGKELNVEFGDDLHVALAAEYDEVENAVKDYFADGKNQDVEWIWIGNTENSVSRIAVAVLEHGPPGVKLMANVWGFSEGLYGLCQQNVGADEPNPCVGNVFGTMPFAAFGDTSREGMAQLVQVHGDRRNAKGEDPKLHADVHYVQGHVTFAMWKLAVERLLDDGKVVTGPAVKQEFESFRNVSTGGLTAPLTLTNTDHRPTSGVFIYGIEESGLLKFKDEISIELKEEWKGW